MIRRLLRDQARLTLVASGVFGIWAGLAHAEWQWAVEFAQMGAGLVHQTADSPFLVLHAKLWSLITQIVTVALAAGLSERAASFIVSGVAGMLSCQALAMLTFAISRRFWVAIGVPPLVLVSGITMHDAIYPVMLMGWSHTFGMFGLSLTLLAVGLVGSGFLRTGAMLAGLSVAVHTSTGAPMIAFVVVAAMLSWRRDRTAVRELATFLAAGLLVAGVSFALHLALRPAIPQPDPETTRRYLLAWTTFWDEHRRPVDWTRLGAWINVVLPIAILAWFPSIRDNATRIACRVLIVATASSLPLGALSLLPPDWLPNSLIIGMPARLLNMGLFAAVPVIVGVLSSGRSQWSRWTAAAAAALLILSSPNVIGFDQSTLLLAIAGVATVLAFVDRRLPVEDATSSDRRGSCRPAGRPDRGHRRRHGVCRRGSPAAKSAAQRVPDGLARHHAGSGAGCCRDTRRTPRDGGRSFSCSASDSSNRAHRRADSGQPAVRHRKWTNGRWHPPDGLRHGSLCTACGRAARRQDSQCAEP